MRLSQHILNYHNVALDGYSVALGNFDGIHLGHQAVIQSAVEYARKNGCKSAVLTFDPYPAEVLSGRTNYRIMSLAQKLNIMAELGVDEMIIIEFDLEFARMQPGDFVAMLCEKFNIKYIVTGENFRFGFGRSGDVYTLQKLGKKHGFTANFIPNIIMNGVVISSSRMREVLRLGCMHLFKKMSDKYYTLSCADVDINTITDCKILRALLEFSNANNLTFKAAKMATDRALPPDGIYLSDVDFTVILQPYTYTTKSRIDAVEITQLISLMHYNFNTITDILYYLENCYRGANFMVKNANYIQQNSTI